MSAVVPPAGGEGGNSIPAGLRINVVPLSLALILLLAILVSAGILAFRQTSAEADVQRSIEVINGLNRVMTGLLDAETGQRGYILTNIHAIWSRSPKPLRIS
jgi:CHASE3 domain sensor protein